MDTPVPAPVPNIQPKPWWVPARKIWAGGLSAVIAWVILALVTHFFPDLAGLLPPDAQTVLSGLIGAAIANYVPPDIQDTLKHVDDAVIVLARSSDASPASETAPPASPSLAAAVVKKAS